MAELQVLQDERVVQVVSLGSIPLNIGRGSNNGLVLAEPSVSNQHATIWVEKGQCWIRDLGSSNGTWQGDQRVHGAVLLRDGDRLRLGLQQWLRLVGAETFSVDHCLMVQDMEAGIQLPLTGTRFYIGSDPQSQLRLPDGPERVATLLVHPQEEIWLGLEDEEEVPLPIGQVFEVGGRKLRVIRVTGTQVPTVGPSKKEQRYPYGLTVTLSGATGPEATLEYPGRPPCRIDAGNRAVLLYLLGKALAEDRAKGLGEEEAGWTTDDDVQSGIWGRGGDDNKLHVLIHRLRQELKKSGFDPWFIEKRHRYIRIRLADVQVR